MLDYSYKISQILRFVLEIQIIIIIKPLTIVSESNKWLGY